MTKWEYFVLQCDKTKREWLSERLNKLGSQGWEAVGIGGGLGIGFRPERYEEHQRDGSEKIEVERSSFMVILKRELPD